MTKIVRRRTTPTPENAPEAVAPPAKSDTYIRKWAQSRGLPCSAKGRIPAKIRKAFDERGPEDVTLYGDPEVFDRKGKDIPDPKNRMLPSGKAVKKRHNCGFCTEHGSARHDLCPGITLNGKLAPRPFFACLCFEKDPEAHAKGMKRLMIAPFAQYSGLILKEAS